MLKKIPKKCFAYLLVLALLLTGCGEPMIELSEDEEAAIVSYAGKVVAKHNVRMGQGLVRFKKDDRDAAKKAEEKEAKEKAAEEAQSQESSEETPDQASQKKEKSKANNNTGEQAPAEGEQELKTQKLADALGLKGVSITYKDAKAVANYTYKNSYDLQPNPGNKYLLVTFTAKNEGGSDVNVDINSKQPKFSATVGAVTSNAEQNNLMNDLATYVGSIPAGGTADLILLFQFAENNLGDISSFSISVDVGGTKSNVAM